MPTMDTSADDPQTFRIRRSPSISSGSAGVGTAPSRAGKRKLSATTFGSSPNLGPTNAPSARPSSPPLGSASCSSHIESNSFAGASSSTADRAEATSSAHAAHDIGISNSHSDPGRISSELYPHHAADHPHHHHSVHRHHRHHHHDAIDPSMGRYEASLEASGSAATSLEAQSSSSMSPPGTVAATPLHELQERRCHALNNDRDFSTTNEDRRDPRSSAACVMVPITTSNATHTSHSEAVPHLEASDHSSTVLTPSQSADPAPQMPLPYGTRDLAQHGHIMKETGPSSTATLSAGLASTDPTMNTVTRPASPSTDTSESGSKDCATSGSSSIPAFSSYFFATPSPKETQRSKLADGVRVAPHSVDSSVSSIDRRNAAESGSPSSNGAWIARRNFRPAEDSLSVGTSESSKPPADIQVDTSSPSISDMPVVVATVWARSASAQSPFQHNEASCTSSPDLSSQSPQTRVPANSSAQASFQLQPVPACKRRRLHASKDLSAGLQRILRESHEPEQRRKSDAGIALSVPASTKGDTAPGAKENADGRPAVAQISKLSKVARQNAAAQSAANVAVATKASDTVVTATGHMDGAKALRVGAGLSRSDAPKPTIPPVPQAASGRQYLLSMKRNVPLPPPIPHAIGSHHGQHTSSSKRRAARLRRAHSVPNLRAKATLDLDANAQHRLILPQHWLGYISSYSRSSKDGSSGSRGGVYRSSKGVPTLGHGHHSNAGSRSRTVFTPSLHPPITRHTLRELDLFEILKNPQLRHDVVFDPNVQFRPNFDGERGRRKREAGERYWTAIVREIQTGCTCTAYDQGELLPCACSPRSKGSPASKDRNDHISVTKAVRAGHGRNMVSPHPRIPSRIPLLVQELRAICLSILPSNFPLETGSSSSNTSASSRSSTSSPQSPETTDKESTGSPSTNGSRAPSPAGMSGSQLPLAASGGPSWAATHHALIAQTLDPHLIAQELQHGVLDVPALVTFMGSILKLHCAPMRDEAIEKMVEVVCVDGDVGKGLRLCFEILELMKLDIANHQLRSTRPYLVETAVEFEIRWFQDQIEQRKISLDRTSAWFAGAIGRIKAEAPGSSRSELVTRSFNDGLLKLIFDAPNSVAIPPSPAPVPSPSSSSLNHTFASLYPETFQFDAYRMMTFHNDVADLTIVYMLLLLFRQLACSPLEVGSTVPAAAAGIAQRQLKAVKGEIWCLLNDANLCLSGAVSSASGLPSPSGSGRRSPTADSKLFLGSAGGFAKLEHPGWRQAMRNVLLQIAVRAAAVQMAANGPVTDPTKIKPPAPSAKTQALLNSWMDTNLCIGSPLHKLCQGRLRGVVLSMLEEKLSGLGGCGASQTSSEKASVGTGMGASTRSPMLKRPSEVSDEESARVAASDANGALKRVKTESGDSKTPAACAAESVAATLKGITSSVKSPVAGTSGGSSTSAAAKAMSGVGSTCGRNSAVWEANLTKAGLDPFSAEIRLLCDRIAKVATFHLRVFRNLYEKMEARDAKKAKATAMAASSSSSTAA